MKVGIFTGAFNPVHKGHRKSAKLCLEHGFVDKIIVAPSLQFIMNYKFVADYEHRLKLAEMMFSGIKNIEVSNIDRISEEHPYTSVCDKVGVYCQMLNGKDTYWIAGSDSVQNYARRGELEKILEFAPLLVVIRPDYPIHPSSFNHLRIIFAGDVGIQGGSRKIREDIVNGKDVTGRITEEMLRYIKEKNIYIDQPLMKPIEDVKTQ